MSFLGIKDKLQLQLAKLDTNTSNNEYASAVPSTPPPLMPSSSRSVNFLTNVNQLQDINSSSLSDVFRTQNSMVQYPVNGQLIPYREAIRALEKITTSVTPREKLQCLSESYGALKTAVVDFHKGKVSKK